MAHPAAEVRVEDQSDVRLVEVRGVLDVFSAGVVGSRILAGVPSGVKTLVLDLEGIEFMDSAGVSAMVRLREHCCSRDLVVHVRLGDSPTVNPTVVAVLRRVLDCDELDIEQLHAAEEANGDAPVGSSA